MNSKVSGSGLPVGLGGLVRALRELGVDQAKISCKAVVSGQGAYGKSALLSSGFCGTRHILMHSLLATMFSLAGNFEKCRGSCTECISRMWLDSSCTALQDLNHKLLPNELLPCTLELLDKEVGVVNRSNLPCEVVGKGREKLLEDFAKHVLTRAGQELLLGFSLHPLTGRAGVVLLCLDE
ncbi:hypothetical protein WJX82_000411 [Trebouxia sp. C0006]